MTRLPIDSALPKIIEHLRQSRSLVLVAPPGAGKTTRVGPAMLREKLLDKEHPNILMLQPRRVAARAAATRIADENGWEIGREVGYQIRFEKRIGPDTRLRVLTEGILNRQLLDDPFLEGVGAVLLDEFHERSLHTDLAIALLREVQQTVRDDLRLIVMSATLEAEPVAKFLGNCPIVRTEGRLFPIQIMHGYAAHARIRETLPDRVADALRDALAHESDDAGDILVFLPGVEEIRRTQKLLESQFSQDGLAIVPLHGSLTGQEQFAALKPMDRRKVILATNIAETSLTIEGVRTVIDSGLARIAGYDAQRGLDRLELSRISKASAAQRAGRSGRTAPGRCIRLYIQADERAMADFETPEVRRVDLCSALLTLHAWGKADPRQFNWYEAPPESALTAAERLLAMLGALTSETDGRLTEIGRRLQSLPVHPRLGRLLLAAVEEDVLAQGAAIAALLSEKDIVRSEAFDPTRMYRPATQSASDLLIRLDLLEQAERQNFSPSLKDSGLDLGAVRQVIRVRDELLRIGQRLARSHAPSSKPGNRPSASDEVESRLLKLPLFAYPDRVARRRGSDPNSAVMVGGGGVRLLPESAVQKAEFFLALDARHDQRGQNPQVLVRIASAIEVDWLEQLFSQSIRRERSVVFDSQRERVVGIDAIYYRDLLLHEDRNAPIDPDQAAAVLSEAIRPRALELFSADESARNWLSRLAFLRQAMPEHPWPKFDAEELADLLASSAHGKRSLHDLRQIHLLPLLQGTLPYPLNRDFEQFAPQDIEVPTGRRIALQYDAGAKPVLAVRLQELFGWTQTPRIAGGRVPVLIHLLGPNYRPVQITEDLASFWATTYFQVRKDLRTRYPKHSWPEDPLTATPQAKGNRVRRS